MGTRGGLLRVVVYTIFLRTGSSQDKDVVADPACGPSHVATKCVSLHSEYSTLRVAKETAMETSRVCLALSIYRWWSSTAWSTPVQHQFHQEQEHVKLYGAGF